MKRHTNRDLTLPLDIKSVGHIGTNSNPFTFTKIAIEAVGLVVALACLLTAFGLMAVLLDTPQPTTLDAKGGVVWKR